MGGDVNEKQDTEREWSEYQESKRIKMTNQSAKCAWSERLGKGGDFGVALGWFMGDKGPGNKVEMRSKGVWIPALLLCDPFSVAATAKDESAYSAEGYEGGSFRYVARAAGMTEKRTPRMNLGGKIKEGRDV